MTARIRRLSKDIHRIFNIPDEQLLAIVRARDIYHPISRLAALRVLIGRAPVEIRCRTYLHAKRAVRARLGV